MQVVTAIFMSYVKIMSSVRLRGSNSKIKIKIPTCEIFIHSVYTKSAQQIFGEPFIFKENVSSLTRHENYKKIIGIINDSIDESITNMVPIENILQEYIGNICDDEDEDEVDDDEDDCDGKSVYVENSDESDDEEQETESEDEELNQQKVINITSGTQEMKNPYEYDYDENHKEMSQNSNDEEHVEEFSKQQMNKPYTPPCKQESKFMEEDNDDDEIMYPENIRNG